MEVTKEQFQQWRGSNVTEAVLDILEHRKDDLIEQLRAYATTGDPIQTARCEGVIEGIEELLAIEYEDSEEYDD